MEMDVIGRRNAYIPPVAPYRYVQASIYNQIQAFATLRRQVLVWTRRRTRCGSVQVVAVLSK